MKVVRAAVGLESVGNVVSASGWLFRLSTVITLTGGTMLLVWLTQQITTRGIGNGIALLLVAGIAAELPRNVLGVVQLGRLGVLSSNEMAALVLIVVAVTGFVAGM